MDRQLAERMVGAACLLLVVVLVVPSILDGNRRSESVPARPDDARSLDLRTHTISLDGTERSPPVPRVLTPEAPGAPPAPGVSENLPAKAEPVASEGAGVPVDSGVSMTEPKAKPQGTPPVKSAELPQPVQAKPVAEVATGSATDTVASKAPPAGGEWFVQLGSFSKRDNAERLVADVSRRGFPAGMAESSGSRGPMYRVRVGPAGSREAASELARKLSTAGFSGQVTRQ